MEQIIEQLNLLHRMAAEKARQTGLDSDWNDAQSLEHEISKMLEWQKWIKATGRKLGVMEGCLRSLHKLHPYSQPFDMLRAEYPDIYVEVTDGNNAAPKET
jgi:hypothetical protein